MNYYPDRWVIVDHGEEYGVDRYAVFAGWSGGYTYGADWRRSSPIVSVVKTDKEIQCTTLSGSVYNLYLDSIGFTGYSAEVAGASELITIDEIEDVLECLKHFVKG